MILAAESEAASRQHMHCVPAYKIHDELQAAEVPPEGNQTLTYYWSFHPCKNYWTIIVHKYGKIYDVKETNFFVAKVLSGQARSASEHFTNERKVIVR